MLISLKKKMREADKIPNTTTIVPDETKVSTTKIQGGTTSGSPAQTTRQSSALVLLLAIRCQV